LKRAAAVIPVRYQSSRFPGKPLALILGKPMIQRVYAGVREASLVDRVIVATDDERILEVAKSFGAEAVLTSGAHNSGMERAAEVAQIIDNNIIINVQGDEPLVTGGLVDSLVEALQDESVRMASLMAKVFDLDLLTNPNINKVVTDQEGFALYFSRSPVPYQASDFFYQHIGIYGYKKDFLVEFAKMKPSRLERLEKLEQLRALENGFRIKMVEASSPTLSVDTPSDIIKVEEFLRKKGHA
jgi:3-deoxy-manno-octulosonate cytidylyltransferase (CMP-KDO synthetase)